MIYLSCGPNFFLSANFLFVLLFQKRISILKRKKKFNAGYTGQRIFEEKSCPLPLFWRTNHVNVLAHFVIYFFFFKSFLE